MKISTRLRYGTRLLLELALHYGRAPLYLKDIARIEDISEKYLGQIIIPLKHAGLVNSYRGAKGGYVLAKPPALITMREVYAALEGDINLVECVVRPGSCSRTAHCVTRNLWSKLGSHISNMLECVTLDDLVKQCENKVADHLMYNI